MKLSFAAHGEGPPLIILHGLFGSGRNWTSMAKLLAVYGWQVFTVDLRNHGASPHADRMSYPDMVKDVRRLIIEERIEQPVVLGHSMGGKTAMGLALDSPDLLRALVVVDIAPIAYPHSNAELVTAMKSLDLSSISSRGEADKFLAETVDDPGIRAFLLHNLLFEGDKPRWQLNLDAIGKAMPSLMAFPYEPVDLPFAKPVLFMAGENSSYMKDVDRGRLKAYFPSSRVATIKGAGHWIHAEAPDAFRDILSGFLATL